MPFIPPSVKSFGHALWFGPGYAAVHRLISHDQPLEPERLWALINPSDPRPQWLEHYPPSWMKRLQLSAKMRQEHRLGIEEHYDVSNAFYELFLDQKYMFYTCADFHSPDDSLEQAQINKADYIANWLEPHAGEKILELGCGWGAMLKRIMEDTEDPASLYGYTLSKEQVEYNNEVNHFQVELKNFITCDYEPDSFDKIYSIGAWEHVRHEDLEPLIKKLRSALRPGGRMLHHFICPLDDAVTSDVVIAQLFFPGSYIPGYDVQTRAFERNGFRFVKRSIHDYRPTLRAWFDRLVANKERAINEVGVATYNRYLVFFAASHSYFDRGKAMLVRWLLEAVDE